MTSTIRLIALSLALLAILGHAAVGSSATHQAHEPQVSLETETVDPGDGPHVPEPGSETVTEPIGRTATEPALASDRTSTSEPATPTVRVGSPPKTELVASTTPDPPRTVGTTVDRIVTTPEPPTESEPANAPTADVAVSTRSGTTIVGGSSVLTTAVEGVADVSTQVEADAVDVATDEPSLTETDPLTVVSTEVANDTVGDTLETEMDAAESSIETIEERLDESVTGTPDVAVGSVVTEIAGDATDAVDERTGEVAGTNVTDVVTETDSPEATVPASGIETGNYSTERTDSDVPGETDTADSDRTAGNGRDAGSPGRPPQLPGGDAESIAAGLAALTAGGAAVRLLGGSGAAWSPTNASTFALSARSGVTAVLDRLRDLPRPPLPIPGYNRHDESDPLANETRSAVYEAIAESPGTYLSGLAATTEIPLSTVRYHLRILEDEELVASTKIWGKRRFYVADDPEGRGAIRRVAAFEDRATRELLTALARLEPISVTDLADELGRSSSTVSHHLTRLADEGLVGRVKRGREVLSWLDPAVREVLDRDEHDRENSE